ncbi:MAG: asparaginase [Rhodoferax sp.]
MGSVVVLGMGGTIAGAASQADDNVGYVAGAVGVDQILGNALTGSALAQSVARVEQVRQKDSKDMDLDDWWVLHERVRLALEDDAIGGVVITHGTDTLEEAAVFLSLLLDESLQFKKPVVFTCAMRPATAQSPDGPQNLRDALAVALDPLARGVLLVCAGKVLAGHSVRKSHPYRVDAFESVDGGVLGFVEEGKPRWICDVVRPWRYAGWASRCQRPKEWPGVDIVLSYSGARTAYFATLLALASQGQLNALVVGGTGNGSIHARLMDVLVQLRSMGVEVVVTSRCMAGSVIGPSLGGEYQSMCSAMTPFQARIALTLGLCAQSR